MYFRLITYFFAFVGFSTLTFSQFFYFGRNKVQYTNFDWHVMKTSHFDIYYYPEMKNLAERGAFFAEESYKALEEKFVHNVTDRIPLIFYSSHLHFQQTNTTPGLVPEGVGGFFEFIKGRVVIPYAGSMYDFNRVIRHELVHVFMHSKISRVLSEHRILVDRMPPLWFTEGLAEYWSAEWDAQAEMVMRDAVISGYFVPLRELDNIAGTYLMYKEGESVVKYIAEKYGEERLLLLLENFWKAVSFEDVFRFTLGSDYEDLGEEWSYALKKEYYPLLHGSDRPSAIASPIVTRGFNSKPLFFKNGGRNEIYFVGNHSGYTSIFRICPDSALADKKLKPSLLIEGEKTDELEAFHLFQSKISVSGGGILAFVTKSGENDALHLYDIKSGSIVKTYKFNDLVAIASPSWAPDGKRIVFTAVDDSGNNDLYLWNIENERLIKLTNDIYDERDPAWHPGGEVIAFTSDRTPFGNRGRYNLFLYHLSTGIISYLTYGDNGYFSPQFSPAGTELIFTSDEDGVRNIWMMKMDSLMQSRERRKITHFTTAAFDPAWADSGLVFTAFEDFSFQLRHIGNVFSLYDTAKAVCPNTFIIGESPWKPRSLPGGSESGSLKYTGEYSLDMAQSQIATDPVFGTAGGAFLTMSDLLGSEKYHFLIYNTAQSTDELLSSFNVAVSRLSLQQRSNYAYGIYRFSGRRYDLTDPDEYFYEHVFGGYFTLSYPISRFRRVTFHTSISHSEKDPTGGFLYDPGEDNVDNSRRALFLSNSTSFIHDNSLWGPSGPIDGSRFNLTLAYTSDVQYSNANYFSVIADYRRYFRIALRSAYAARLWLFYNDGEEARRFFIGGSWDLRGYPRWSIRGKKLWLTSHELRYPFIDHLSVKFPVAGLAFFGIRGALFFDAGSAWDDEYEETLGSVGTGIRINLLNFIVLRYDIGKRIESRFRKLQSGLFHQFFFGWDF